MLWVIRQYYQMLELYFVLKFLFFKPLPHSVLSYRKSYILITEPTEKTSEHFYGTELVGLYPK